MAKKTDDSVMDAALTKLATAVRLVVCSAEPANFAGIAAVALADVVLTAGNGNGDWTIANGDTSGRKITCAAQAAVPIDTSGTATHVVTDDGSLLLDCTTCPSQALVAGGTVDVAAFAHTIPDPT
jgi:hypothetical protein